MSDDSKVEELEEPTYVPLPASLFSFAPLEEYLHNLTYQLSCDISEIKRQMNRSSDNAKHARMSVRQVKLFLSEKMPQLEKSHKAALAAMSSAVSGTHIHAASLSRNSFPSAHSQESVREPEMTDRTMTPLRPPSGSKFSEFPSKDDGDDPEKEKGSSETKPEGTQETATASGLRLTDIAPSASDEDEQEGSANLSLSEIREDVGRWSENKGSASASSRTGSQMERLSDRGAQNSANSNKRVLAMVKDLQVEVDRVKEELLRNTAKTQDILESTTLSKHQLSSALREVQKCERDCHQLSRLLGVLHPESGDLTAHSLQGDSTEVTSASEQQMEALIANSPLLLTLRRVLLKDLADRVANSAEVQSKDVTTTVGALREDMEQFVTEEKVMSIVEAHGKDEIREVIAEYERRLMEIELTSVRRQEFVTALKTKADSYLVSQQTKVGASDVLSMEKRLYERIEELEERVAYYEAERSELREIILSLLKVENPGMETNANKLLSRKSFPPFRPRAVIYSGNADSKEFSAKEECTGSSTMTNPSFQPHEVTNKAVYRLVNGDDEQNTFVTLAQNKRQQRADSKSGEFNSSMAPSSRDGNSSTSKTSRGSPRTLGSPVEKNAESARKEMIGLTKNQEAYARFVTQDFNRNVVNNLPPIPYERRNA